MREELFRWLTKMFGEKDFMGFLEYNESTVNRIYKDTRIYRITEIKFTVGLSLEKISKKRLKVWQDDLTKIFELIPLDRFEVEVDHSKRLTTPGEVDVEINRGIPISNDHFMEKESMLLRVNVFKRRPYKEK